MKILNFHYDVRELTITSTQEAFFEFAMTSNQGQGKAVWDLMTTSGFRQQVYVMFHSTTPENASSILKNGFEPSDKSNTMLGQGIYVSKDLDKAIPYGPVTFKLLVYVGRVKAIREQGHPLQKEWQRHFSTAWVPPNCGMVDSGREENCVKSKRQITFLGVVQGFHLLDRCAQSLTNVVSPR